MPFALQLLLVIWSSFGLLIFFTTFNDIDKGKTNGYQLAFLLITYGPIAWALLILLFCLGAGIAFYDYLGKLGKPKK